MASGGLFGCLLGRLTRDPEVRTTAGGTASMKVGVGWNTRFNSKSKDEMIDRAHFIEVEMYGARGAAFAQYHKKGSNVFFNGYVEMMEWEDRETKEKKRRHVFHADNWCFVPRETGSSNDARDEGNKTRSMQRAAEDGDRNPF